MIKLKKVISQLDENTFETIVSQFQKTKADNFLFLLTSYRESAISDSEIMKKLSLSNNSFYVLKSRLYDKVQDNLSTHIDLNKDDVLKQFQQLSETAYRSPREVASAMLHKLEEGLLHFDLHNELVILYSILKRINLYSEKYFHYSQLYNKHIAFTLSIEKSVDILGSFNRKLNQYLYSRSDNFLYELQFLHKEIEDYYALNANRPIEIVKNFIELQLHIFCGQLQQLDAQEVIAKTRKLIHELPDSSFFKNWDLPLEYLSFEFYFRSRNIAKAKASFEKVDENINHLLLSSGVCTTADFLTAKLAFLHEVKQDELIQESDPAAILVDPNDVYAIIKQGLYKAMILFYKGKIKDSVTILNRILGDNSFKDFIHINLEVKLTLAYLYLHLQEFDLADNLLKNLQRKVKTDHEAKYPAVFDLLKVLNAAITNSDVNKKNAKQKDHMTLFLARNTGQQRLLDHLEHDLIKKFA
jgi:hypothetical protein